MREAVAALEWENRWRGKSNWPGKRGKKRGKEKRREAPTTRKGGGFMRGKKGSRLGKCPEP